MNVEKYSVNGNTFIIFQGDCKKNYSDLACKLCDVNRGIGSDGMIVVTPDNEITKHDFTWSFYNCDGSKADFCGNGACAVSYFAYKHKLCGKDLKFHGEKYSISAKIDELDEQIYVTVKLPVAELICQVPDEVDHHVYLVNTGTLHLVIVLNDGKYDRFDYGKFMEVFLKWNKNVNVTIMKNKSDYKSIPVKTFEKGVERVTSSCGTGKAASYIVMRSILNVKENESIGTVLYPSEEGIGFNSAVEYDKGSLLLTTVPILLATISVDD